MLAPAVAIAQNEAPRETSTVDPPGQSPILPTASSISPEEEARLRSALRLLETTLDRRPQEDWIPSARMVSRHAKDADLLLPEGSRVVDRPGKLRQQEEWWVFEPATGDPPLPTLRLLPNAALEAAVLTWINADPPPDFSLSGEVLLFENQNYLLLRLAVRHHSPPPLEGAPAREAAPAESDESPANDSATMPRRSASEGEPAEARPPEPERLIGLMRGERPRREVISSAALEREQAPRAPSGAAAGGAPMLDQIPLVRRVGRLAREGSWWSFAFESGQAGAVDVPLRLLPCQSLQRMIAAQENAPPDAVFVVSGEVTAYDGLNYLLVRSATRRLELGNLKR